MKGQFSKTITFLMMAIFCFSLFAEEERSLGKSPRGLLMGDAYTSLADDDFSLFYNPALLARHSGFSFYPLNPAFSVVNVLAEPDKFNDMGETPTEIAGVIFDFPVHIGVDYAPGFKMGRFGLTALVNYNTNFNLQNQITPALDIDHRFDRGFVAGYGMPIFGNYKSGSSGTQLAAGVAVKYIQREAIYGSYNLTGYSLLDALSAGDADTILESLGKINGNGWGFDAGFDYVTSSGAQTFSASLALLDIYTLMHTESNEGDLKVQDQPMRVHFGTAYTASAPGGFDFTLSADIKHLEQQMELMRRLHLGVELNLTPAISVLAGLSAVDNYSYGVKFDMAIAKVYLGLYTSEIGEKLQQQESNRFLLYISLLDFTFEP